MENNNKAFISIQNVEKIYPNGEKAVYNFNLDIQRNEFIIIVGPSGCGKSTTLRMIAGLEDISSGSIYMEDELLNFKPCKDRKMAIVFQSYALYPQMNVYGNIAFPLTINKYPSPVINETLLACSELKRRIESSDFDKIVQTVADVRAAKDSKTPSDERLATIFGTPLCGGKLLLKLYASSSQADKTAWLAQIEKEEQAERDRLAQNGVRLNESFCEVDEDGNEKTVMRKLTDYEIKKKVYETAEKLDLTAYLDKLPKELSGGQMQRVALGRAIIKNVPVFLMDEPLSNLDAKLRLTMRSEIVKLHNRINATTIYVTHDQTEAMTMATRIVVMSRGFIQQIGTPSEVYNAPNNLFVAKFIGSPSMNLFDMQYDIEHNKLDFQGLEIELPAEFAAKHKAFYEEKIAEFERINQDFDVSAREFILKITSATGENIAKNQKTEKMNIFKKLKEKLSKKEQKEEIPQEKLIAEDKLAKLQACLHSSHVLTVGIRPERIEAQKAEAGKKYPNSVIVKPTVCELLGGEYSVHFDFCGKDTVARMDAKTAITTNDEVAITFLPEDMYVFDPITCDVIK